MCLEAPRGLSQIGEFGLIEFFAQVGRGLGDDCAVLDLGGPGRVCVSTDMLMEGVHFRLETTSAWQLGWKSLAVNLSDLAAMGAVPTACLLAVAWPVEIKPVWIEAFRDGLAACAKRFDCVLVGGDTVKSPGLMCLSLTVLGKIAEGEAVERRGGDAGDLLFVAGFLGDSAAGLHLLTKGGGDTLSEEERLALIAAHLQPEPQVALGRVLAREGLATAMIDLSDGLLQDLGHVARASGLGAVVVASHLPISRAAGRLADACGLDVLNWALSGGEDYLLLFAIPPMEVERMEQVCGQLKGRDPVRIGVLTDDPGLRLQKDGLMMAAPHEGYDHFAKNPQGAEEEEK